MKDEIERFLPNGLVELVEPRLRLLIAQRKVNQFTIQFYQMFFGNYTRKYYVYCFMFFGNYTRQFYVSLANIPDSTKVFINS